MFWELNIFTFVDIRYCNMISKFNGLLLVFFISSLIIGKQYSRVERTRIWSLTDIGLNNFWLSPLLSVRPWESRLLPSQSLNSLNSINDSFKLRYVNFNQIWMPPNDWNIFVFPSIIYLLVTLLKKFIC